MDDFEYGPLIEVRMQSGKEFHFLGEEAEKVHSKLLEHKVAPITAIWGLPPSAEVTMWPNYIECHTWYANGRP